MAFDGIVTRAITKELSEKLQNGKIMKAFQPEKDEIHLLVHNGNGNYRLLISANPSNAGIYLTENAKENPMSCPNFCMMLRKHIQGGTIGEITQNGCDRTVSITVHTYNELGDPVDKKLVAEIMGRHSNIILLNSSNIILDAIRHVDERISSFREVLPARPYVSPPVQDKLNPCGEITAEDFPKVTDTELSASAYLLSAFSGFSYPLCNAICKSAGLNPNEKITDLSPECLENLKKETIKVLKDIKENNYHYFLYDNDFHCLKITEEFGEFNGFAHYFTSASAMVENYFSERSLRAHLKEHAGNMEKLISSNISRVKKKLSVYEKEKSSAENFEDYRMKGELVTSYIYMIQPGASELVCSNFYAEDYPEIAIPLYNNLSPAENAAYYFKQYRKKKSKYENSEKYLKETREELDYLLSVSYMLQNAKNDMEIDEISEELISQGYAKRKQQKGFKKRPPAASLPYTEITVSDGYVCWLGKNNIQNDLITTKLSSGNDIWFHKKNAPGAHVILRCSQMGGAFTKDALLDGARLAAYGTLNPEEGSRTEVDYTRVKYVKKPVGARPGHVIFTEQKSIIV